MILRKFQQHVENQNWVAVGLDVIVVVVGIFLGMQLNDWNEGRKEQSEGYYYLDLLRQQLNREILRREADITGTSNRIDRIKHAASLLYADSWTDKELEEFTDQHVEVYQHELEEHRPSALRQLVEAGRIDLLRSRRMQEKLFDLDQEYKDAISQSDTTERIITNAVLALMGEIHYGSRDDLYAMVTQPEILLNSRKLKDAMYLILVLNHIQRSTFQRLQEACIEARDELDGYLGSRSTQKSADL